MELFTFPRAFSPGLRARRPAPLGKTKPRGSGGAGLRARQTFGQELAVPTLKPSRVLPEGMIHPFKIACKLRIHGRGVEPELIEAVPMDAVLMLRAFGKVVPHSVFEFGRAGVIEPAVDRADDADRVGQEGRINDVVEPIGVGR